MLRVLEVTFPVFALVFCGYFGQRWRLLPDRAVDGINAFVFYFALPAMLFRVIGSQPIASFTDWRFAAAYALGGLSVFLFARRAAMPVRPSADPAKLAGQRSQAAAFGLNAAHGNIGYLGVPLALELGTQTVPSMVLAIICDIFVVITLTLGLLEFHRHRGEGTRGALAVARTVVVGLVRSPLLVSIGAGLVWAVESPPMPDTLDNFTRILGGAAGPCALFAIGAALGDRRIRIDAAVSALVTIKLVVHPALVAVLMFFVFRVDPGAAAIGVLAASLPSASNSFIIAQRYEVEARDISASILVGTFAALASVSLVIWVFRLAPLT